MPGIRVNFTVNAESFSKALANYAYQVQNEKSRTDVVRDQMKLAIRGIIDLTPPDTLAQGRQAVHTQLLRAVKPYGGEDGSFSHIDNDGLRTRLQNYVRSSQFDKIKDVFAKIGAKGYYAGYEMADFSPELHHRWQTRRGRVETDHKVLTPQVREWQMYLEHLQGQVGRARGGWTQSAEAVGLNLPQWITRWRSGGAVNALIEPGRVTFTFINRAIFIPDYRDKVEVALAGREKAMAEDLRRMYAGAATHAGFGGR
jgi:hypothetical protein